MNNSSLQIFPITSETKVIQLIVCVVLLAASVMGNGVIVFLVLRFKALRTVSNIFLANLACVDFVNALVTLPFFIDLRIIDITQLLSNQKAVWWFLFLNCLFRFWSLASLFILVMDRYFAIAHEIKYNLWKTRTKAVIVSIATGIIVLATFLTSAIPVYKTQLAKKSSVYSHSVYWSKSNKALEPIGITLVIAVVMASAVTFRMLRKKRILLTANAVTPKESTYINKQTLSKSAETVLLLVTVYAVFQIIGLCFWQAIDLTTMGEKSKWFYFCSFSLIFVSRSINAFIYTYRSSRFRAALKETWKRLRKRSLSVSIHIAGNPENQKHQIFYIQGIFGKEKIVIQRSVMNNNNEH